MPGLPSSPSPFNLCKCLSPRCSNRNGTTADGFHLPADPQPDLLKWNFGRVVELRAVLDLKWSSAIVKQRAITPISTRRNDLYGFDVNRRIHEADIEWMAQTLQTAFTQQGKVDIIIVMREWDGIDLAAAFDSQSLAAQARANKHVRKYAVVGAPGWAKAMINLFSPLTPVEEKTFDISEEREAWAWVDGDTSFADARARTGERP